MEDSPFRYTNYDFKKWFRDVDWRIENRHKEIARLEAEIRAIEGEKSELIKALKEDFIP